MRRRRSLSHGFSPRQLFNSGAKGAWYDPSDYSTLFQDSAGAIPVTAVEQSVRLMLDKSGNGNHATAPSDASRPVLRARYNQLTYSEQFDNAIWAKTPSTVTANVANSPIGTLTADKFTPTASAQLLAQTGIVKIAAAITYSASFYAKADGQTSLRAYVQGATNANRGDATFNLSNGTASAVSSVGSFTNTSASITSMGDGWYRCVIVTTSDTAIAIGLTLRFDGTASGSNGFLLWGAQLVTGSSAGTYQQIAAATDYATAGFLPYLAFDGTDDSFSTGSIDFTSTDKMAVVAGVAKLSDAAQAAVVELSATIASNNGSFLLTAPNSAAANFNFSSKGTTQVNNIVTTYASPYVAVLAASGSISGGTNAIKVNGGTATTVTSSQGTGNYGNYAMYVGRRNNASLPFNGRMYQMIVCGKALSALELSAVETFVNRKTGAY